MLTSLWQGALAGEGRLQQLEGVPYLAALRLEDPPELLGPLLLPTIPQEPSHKACHLTPLPRLRPERSCEAEVLQLGGVGGLVSE